MTSDTAFSAGALKLRGWIFHG